MLISKNRILRQFISESLIRGIIIENELGQQIDWKKWLENNSNEKIKGVPLRNVLKIAQLLQTKQGAQSKKIISKERSVDDDDSTISTDMIASIKENLFDFAEDAISLAEEIEGKSLTKESLKTVIGKIKNEPSTKLVSSITNIFSNISDTYKDLTKLQKVRLMNKYLDEILNKDFPGIEGIFVANIFDAILEKSKLVKFNAAGMMENRRR